MTLAELLLDAAPDVPGVSTIRVGPGMEFRVGDRLVAALGADGAGEFRLDPAVAAAARRTPDTAASDRGAEWVSFAPETLDDHGADRAVAWLRSAARRAGAG
jgi:hypothetical protein